MIKYIDLFCGIGGFHLAMSNNGAKCVFASDWDKYSRITYAKNFDIIPIGDINSVPISSIPKFEILCAGFPCQPFSLAGVSKKNSLGKKHGFCDEKQGNHFFTIANIIEQHRPKAFILENVKNLLSHDKKRTFKIILNTLENTLGYHVFWKVIDASHYVPQHRERVFIVGFKDDVNFKFPPLPNKKPLLKTILSKPNLVPDKYTLSTKLWKYLQSYAEKHRKAGNGFGYGLVDNAGISRTLSARYYKDGSEILIKQIDSKNPRRLTPRECSLLMGFPKSFKIPVSDTQAYRQFGNSLVVPLARDIAKEVIRHLS